MKNEVQSDQLVNEAALPVLRQPARTQGDVLLPAIDQNFGGPLRLFASNPSDAFLHFSPQEIQLADGTGKSVPPTSSTIPTVPASTINFQTGATTGATFTGLTFPSTTIGQFRRVGFTLLASGSINAIWSPAAASVAALANPGTVFVPTGVPLGFIDLEATASTAYKTAGSGTAIIENSVGGVSRIKVFGSGGGGSGTGNANSFLIELQERLSDSLFMMMTPNIFSLDAATKVDLASTGSFDIANQVFSLPVIGNTLLSTQMYDATFLAAAIDNVQTELLLEWGIRDPIAVYEVTRDGGLNWLTLAMSRVGESLQYRGIGVFPEPVVVAALSTYAVGNADSQVALNATTQQQLAVSFTVAAKSRTSLLRIYANKLGLPLGMVWGQIVGDSAGSPDLTNIVAETSMINVSGLAAGNVLLDFSITQPLPVGTYWLLLKTDAAYKSAFGAGVNELRWRTDASGPTGPGVLKSYNGTVWASSAEDATYLINGIPYDLRVRITSATTAVTISGYGILYEEDTLGLPADNEEAQTFHVNGDSDQTSFVVTNFNVSPKTLKVYDTDNDTVYRYPKFAVNGNTVVFAAGTFLVPGKSFKVIFEQSPLKQGYSTDKLAAVLASNGLGSADANFDYSAPGIGPIVQRPDGTKRMITLDNSDNFIIKSVP
jgi:hypothetical protein